MTTTIANFKAMSKFKQDWLLEKIRKGIHIYRHPIEGTYLGSIEKGDPSGRPMFPLFRSQQEAQDYGKGDNRTLRITLKQDRSEVFWFAYR